MNIYQIIVAVIAVALILALRDTHKKTTRENSSAEETSAQESAVTQRFKPWIILHDGEGHWNYTDQDGKPSVLEQKTRQMAEGIMKMSQESFRRQRQPDPELEERAKATAARKWAPIGD